MFKFIKGTWFEFQHPNIYEGKYWNKTCAEFSEEQWQLKIKEIQETGMEYLVLLSTALNDKAYFKTDIYEQAELKCKNPLENFLAACDKYNMKVFVGGGFYGDWTKPLINMTNKKILKRTLKAINQLAEGFGHHKSFYGWYWPDETFIDKYFSEKFITYVNMCSKEARTVMPAGKILVAPYGTRVVIPDDKFVGQLEKLDVDIIAYQDEVGVRKTKVEESASIYAGLQKAHAKAGRSKLWADVEIFDFEGEVYKSALISAPFDRIKKQLEAVSPYVEDILVYQYQGMMNKPGSPAFAGCKASTKLYEDYIQWKKEIHAEVL